MHTHTYTRTQTHTVWESVCLRWARAHELDPQSLCLSLSVTHTRTRTHTRERARTIIIAHTHSLSLSLSLSIFLWHTNIHTHTHNPAPTTHIQAELGDEFEVMHAYSHIVKGMQQLLEKKFDLHPNTTATIAFVGTCVRVYVCMT